MALLTTHAVRRPTSLLVLSLMAGLLLGGIVLLAGRLPGLGALEDWRRLTIAVLALSGALMLTVTLGRRRSPAPAGIGVGLLVAADVALVHAVGTSLTSLPSPSVGAAVVAPATYAVIFAVLGLHLLTLKVLGGEPLSRERAIRDARRRSLHAPRARAAARTSHR